MLIADRIERKDGFTLTFTFIEITRHFYYFYVRLNCEIFVHKFLCQFPIQRKKRGRAKFHRLTFTQFSQLALAVTQMQPSFFIQPMGLEKLKQAKKEVHLNHKCKKINKNNRASYSFNAYKKIQPQKLCALLLFMRKGERFPNSRKAHHICIVMAMAMAFCMLQVKGGVKTGADCAFCDFPKTKQQQSLLCTWHSQRELHAPLFLKMFCLVSSLPSAVVSVS